MPQKMLLLKQTQNEFFIIITTISIIRTSFERLMYVQFTSCVDRVSVSLLAVTQQTSMEILILEITWSTFLLLKSNRDKLFHWHNPNYLILRKIKEQVIQKVHYPGWKREEVQGKRGEKWQKGKGCHQNCDVTHTESFYI